MSSTPDSARAWIVSAAAFVVCFVVYGVLYSFGVFFKPMTVELGAGHASASIIFSVTVCVYGSLSLLGGNLSDRFGPRPLIIAGATAIGCGLAATGFIHSLWPAYLTYGLGVGLGVACTYVPMLAVVSGWFVKRRNIALAIAVSGTGCGILVVAPVAAALVERFGWRDSYVILGIASAAILLVCAMLVERPPMPTKAGALHLRSAMRTPGFAMLYAAALFSSISIYMPFVYLPEFAQSRGISQVAAASVVGVIGGVSILGRLGLGVIADRIGVISLYKASVLTIGMSYGLWLFSYSYGVLVLFAVVMGLAYGGIAALQPAVAAELFGVRGLGSILGVLITSASFSAFLGPPLAGLIVDHTGSYLWAGGFAGIAGVAGFLILFPLKAHIHRTIPLADAD